MIDSKNRLRVVVYRSVLELRSRVHHTEKQSVEYVYRRARMCHVETGFPMQSFEQFYRAYKRFKHETELLKKNIYALQIA